MDIAINSEREYAGCFDIINNILLMGLIRAKKYKEFSMIWDRSIVHIFPKQTVLSILYATNSWII